MEFEPDIAKLENVVTRLLDEYETVKKKCEQLTIDLAESVSLVEELKEEKIILMSEKDTVHSRVTTILEKLSDWEDGVAVSNEVPESHDPGGQLFSMGSSS